MGFSVWSKPTRRPVNPLGGNTINRRAVCGRPACTVRRGEGPKPIGPSYPILWIEHPALAHDIVEHIDTLGPVEGHQVVVRFRQKPIGPLPGLERWPAGKRPGDVAALEVADSTA